MKYICKCLSGSRMYGLETSASDYDERGIFYHDDLPRAIGLDRFEHQDIKEGGEDSFSWEIRHYLGLLRKCNTMVVEILFNKNWTLKTPEWDYILDHKIKLLDSERLYKSIKGYLMGEYRLFNGERSGKAGAARREAIEKYGFSPKNASHIFRLCFCGKKFFETGEFPTNLSGEHERELIYSVKTQPSLFKKEELVSLMKEKEAQLDEAFEKRVLNYQFDTTFAHGVCLEIYGPVIKEMYGSRSIF